VAAGDDDRLDRLAAVRDHGGNCAGFGAGTLRVRGVLDVAADEQLAAIVEQRRTDTVIRILAVGVCPHGKRRIDQVLFVHAALSC